MAQKQFRPDESLSDSSTPSDQGANTGCIGISTSWLARSRSMWYFASTPEKSRSHAGFASCPSRFEIIQL